MASTPRAETEGPYPLPISAVPNCTRRSSRGCAATDPSPNSCDPPAPSPSAQGSNESRPTCLPDPTDLESTCWALARAYLRPSCPTLVPAKTHHRLDVPSSLQPKE